VEPRSLSRPQLWCEVCHNLGVNLSNTGIVNVCTFQDTADSAAADSADPGHVFLICKPMVLIQLLLTVPLQLDPGCPDVGRGRLRNTA